MALKHNKKRNCGLLAEFFARYMAECLVSKKHDEVGVAKNIWDKHIKEGTELQKEIQLFRALYKTKLQNEEIALELLNNARESAKQINSEKLEKEKTELIQEIQREIKDPKFFNKTVDDYTTHATIQILLNSWIEKPLTEGVINPAITELQDLVLSHILKENTKPSPDPSSIKSLGMTNDDINGMVVNIMTEKINKKFGDLSEEQKTILRQYVFGDDKIKLTRTLMLLKEETKMLIDKENAVKKSKKLTEIKRLLEDDFENVSDPDEQCITFYMTVSKLHEELKDEEK